MLTRFLRPRSPQTASDAETIKEKLSAFGENATHNPVKDQIADLRALRDAGRVSDGDYANSVADLLGTPESALG
jgi:hypothetical protein